MKLIAVSERTGHRWYDAEIRRARGEILFKQNPANPGPAEDAFLAAIAIAQAQKARSFELRAALSLAKLYQSTARPVEAHAVLGPALEGFLPTPEMPEIEEAKALLDALAETDAVKAASAAQRRHVRLQVAYGNALIAARGHDAPETAAAYERARDLAIAGDPGSERLSVSYGLWIGSFVRGELPAMRRHSEAFLRDCASRPDSGEACVANRIAGATNLMSGDFVAAREHLEKALAVYDAERDRDLAFRYGTDLEISALSWTPLVLWPLGEQRLAQERAERLGALIAGDGHAASRFYALVFLALYAMLRREKGGPEPVARSLSRHADKYEMGSWRGLILAVELGGLARRPSEGTPRRNARRTGEGTGARRDRLGALRPIDAGQLRGGGGQYRGRPRLDRSRDFRSGAYRAALVRGGVPSHPRRNSAQARPHRPRARRRRLPYRHRHRASRRRPAASNCAPRSRSPSSINRPAAPPKRTASSRPRSKVLRRRPRCPRLQRRRRWWQHWRRPRKSRPRQRGVGDGFSFSSATARR